MKCLCKYLCFCFANDKKTKREKTNSGYESSSSELKDTLIEGKPRISRNKQRLDKDPETKDSSSDEIIDNPIFDLKYYLDEEITTILYTEAKILDIISKEFSKKNKSYEEFYNKDNMTLFINEKGSFINPEVNMIKMIYWIPKSNFPLNATIKEIAEYVNDPVKRVKWDTSLKKFEIISQNGKSYLLHTWMNKPVFFISERDFIEKKIDFEFGGIFYSFSSSIKDELFQKIPNVERVTNYMSTFQISEDKDRFYFKTLNQIDYKMKTPRSLLSYTLPSKLKEWYSNLAAQMNKDHSMGEKR